MYNIYVHMCTYIICTHYDYSKKKESRDQRNLKQLKVHMMVACKYLE